MQLPHSLAYQKYLKLTIYYRATLCVSAVFAVAWYLSVRLSVTLMDFIQTAEDIVKLFLRPGSHIVLVFWPPAPVPNSEGTPSAGAQASKWTGVGKMCDFRLKSPFISETVRDRSMVAIYGTLIGSHRWQIDPCRFRWPWVIFDPDFKVTTFFKVEYLKHGAF